MGEPQLGQQSKGVTGDAKASASPTPGKSTLGQETGTSGLFNGTPQWESVTVMGDTVGGGKGADPEDDPTVVPPEFTQMDPQLIQLLGRSRTMIDQNGAPVFGTKKFWTAMKDMSVADVHTLTQIQSKTMAAGLWPHITTLKSVYTHNTSFGIFFTGSDPTAIATNGSWGKDNPQARVQAEHHNGTNYTWYRQASGAGTPGLHLGIGSADHDVHIDPNNPMRKVSEGEWALIPPTWKPKGDAIYHPWYVAEHGAEVTFNLDTENAKQNRSYRGMYFLNETGKHATNYINAERGAQPRTKDLAKSNQIIGWIEAVNVRIATYNAKTRELAMKQDAAAAAELEGMDVNVGHTRRELITLLVSLAQHMHAEAPEIPMEGWDTRARWNVGDTFNFGDLCGKLTAARKGK